MTGNEAVVLIVVVIAIVALVKHEVTAGFDVPGKGSFFLHAKDPARKKKPKRPSRKLPSNSQCEPDDESAHQ